MTGLKLTSLASLMILSAVPLGARQLTPTEALDRALTDSPTLARGINNQKAPVLAHTAMTPDGKPAIYVFNNHDKGYILLTADDAAIPVLGYSDKGSFTADNIPPQLQWWISEYAAQIEYARQNNLPEYTPQRKISRSGQKEAIAPMVKTMWDQVEPYNNQCPLSGSQRTWTGCVATAMAQVMKYWEYPEKGEGSVTYSIESIQKKVSMDFSLKKFDWENMLNSYLPGKYTEDEANAVAYLMKAAGYSVKMQYGLDSSGALGMNIGRALTKYFNYDENLLYTLRQYYSATQWEDMVYDNLKNVGPILFGGGSTLGGGHSFVCDGYDGEGLYHFNWGWSGMSDGYFRLEALNPDALGTGGGSGGGYNFNQDAIFGIQPPTGKPVENRPVFVTQEGELSGTVSRSNLSFSLVNAGEPMWVNYNPATLKVKFGAMFYPQGETAGNTVYYDISDKRLQLEPGYGTSPQVLKAQINLQNLQLSDGTYKVVCGSVPVDDAGSAATDSVGFVPVKPQYGCPNYFILKKEGSRYSVENNFLEPLKITGEVVGGLYYGALATVRVTAENPSDIERTVGFAPVFMDSEGPLLLGESICVVIPPKSTITKEWSTPLIQFVQFIDPYLDSSLTFTFFDETNFDFYTDVFTKKVTLNGNPGTPVFSFSKPLTVEGAHQQLKNLMIPDPMNIHVTGELALESGYFNYPVVVCLCTPAAGGQVQIECTASQNVFMSMNSEETKKAALDVTFSYPLADYSQQYYLVSTYQGPAGLEVFGNPIPVKFADPAGVEEIETAGDYAISFDRASCEISIIAPVAITDMKVYDVTGRRADQGVSISGMTAKAKIGGNGIIILSVTGADGKVKTVKLK
ncbi:MAG: C10 family peptidase [Muribaculaceae bacterium]|nr:C10 family peptidase [Muribaculaceae bacterium]